MTRLLAVILVAICIGQCYASGYEQEVITHGGIDQKFCYNSKDCKYDETCERVCFWREHTNQFVGCKVTCVKKYPKVAEGYRTVLPLEVHVKEVYKPAPVYHSPKVYHPKPKPTYHTAPKPHYEHRQACQYDKECGFGMHCNYEKLCECNYGLVPDPHYKDRCVDLHPKQTYPAPAYPQPAYHPEPAPYHAPAVAHHKPSYPSYCSSTYDCGYGEKCCFWKNCDAYGHCKEERKCAKHC